MELELEIREGFMDSPDKSEIHPRILITPPLNEDYWVFRVKVSEEQAILGFKKFSTIGIGFAKEEDWNTNLPWTSPAEDIWNHIRHNKGDESIPDEDCLEAIKMVQRAVETYKEDMGVIV